MKFPLKNLIFIIIIILFFWEILNIYFFSEKNNVIIKKIPVTQTNFTEERTIYWKELLINDIDTQIFFLSVPWTWGCNGWVISATDKNNVTQNIMPLNFVWEKSEIYYEKPPYFLYYKKESNFFCPLDIKYIKENILEIPICYSWWGGSGECYYALMNYNLVSQKWTYKKSWFVSLADDHNSIIIGILNFLTDRDLEKNFDITFYDFITRMKKSNLLESEKNIPKIYQ
jgi:hypothetical protein